MATNEGDPRADPTAEHAQVEQLLAEHLPGLRAFIRLRAGKLVREKESMSDLAQSVCREVLQHRDRFQFAGDAGFRNWLYTTALRKILNRKDYYLAAKRDAVKEVDLAAGAMSGDDAALENCYRTLATPSRAAVAREGIEAIEASFDDLPPHYAEVIVMAKLVGLSAVEIGEQLGKSEGAVWTLLSRALSALADAMEKRGLNPR